MSSNIVVGIDGTLTFIHSDELAGLRDEGTAQIERASDVEWDDAAGGWLADMARSDGPILRAPDGRGFALRSEALAAEVEWLEREVLHV